MNYLSYLSISILMRSLNILPIFYEVFYEGIELEELIKKCGLKYSLKKTQDFNYELQKKDSDEKYYFSKCIFDNPDALKKLREFLIRYRVSDNELTLDHFIVSHIVKEENDFSEYERFMIKCCHDDLQKEYIKYIKNPDKYYIYKWKSYKTKEIMNYIIPKKHSDVLLLEGDKTLKGGIKIGTRYIYPEYQRNGYGIDLILFSYYHPELKLLFPAYYSRQGYETRLKAFEIIKENAKKDTKIADDF